MMRLFRRAPKASSPSPSDKNESKKSETKKVGTPQHSEPPMKPVGHPGEARHAGKSPRKPSPSNSERVYTETRRTKPFRRHLNGLKLRSGSDDNGKSSSSSSSSGSDSHTFLSVESNDFNERVHQLEGENVGPENLTISLNMSPTEDRANELRKSEEQAARAARMTNSYERAEKADTPDTAKYEQGSADDRKPVFPKTREKNKYSPLKKKHARNGYNSPTYAQYYSPTYQGYQGYNYQTYQGYPVYGGYSMYQYQNYLAGQYGVGDYGYKETDYSTPIHHQVDAQYYRDEFYTSPNAKKGDKGYVDLYIVNYPPYEPPIFQTFNQYMNGYSGSDYEDLQNHFYSTRDLYDIRDPNFVNGDKAHTRTLAHKVKQRQSSALQILNPETGEVVNSTKPASSKEESKLASKEGSETEGKEDRKEEEAAISPSAILRFSHMLNQQQRMIGQLQGAQKQRKTKARARIKNVPINPSEALPTLTELHPYRETLYQTRERSKSHLRKIANVALTSASNTTSGSGSTLSEGVYPEEVAVQLNGVAKHEPVAPRHLTNLGKIKVEVEEPQPEPKPAKTLDQMASQLLQGTPDEAPGTPSDYTPPTPAPSSDQIFDRLTAEKDSHMPEKLLEKLNADQHDQHTDKPTETHETSHQHHDKQHPEQPQTQEPPKQPEHTEDKPEPKPEKQEKTPPEKMISDKLFERPKGMEVDRKGVGKTVGRLPVPKDEGVPGVFSVNRMLLIYQVMPKRREEELGHFKQVPLNYTISNKRRQRKVDKEHREGRESRDKWRSEVSIEKEQITTNNLRKTNLSKEEQYKRSIRTLLNKLTVENFLKVSEKIAALYEQATRPEEVKMMVDLLHEKATTELDYSDMYADLAFLLKYTYNDRLDVGYKSCCFQRTLLNKCQDSFEDISTNHGLKKEYILGNIRFMGELFLRKILSITILKRISHALLTSRACPDDGSLGDSSLVESGAVTSDGASSASEYPGSSEEDAHAEFAPQASEESTQVSELSTQISEERPEFSPESHDGSRSPASPGPGRLHISRHTPAHSDHDQPPSPALHDPEKTDHSEYSSDESMKGSDGYGVHAHTPMYPPEGPASPLSSDSEDFDDSRHPKRLRGLEHAHKDGLLGTSKDSEGSSDYVVEPPVNLLECFTELLTTIGYTVEQIMGGREMLDEYVAILLSLKNSNVYPTRINFKIQDLIDLRNRNWKKKLFREKATSVSQIHKQVEQEQLRGASLTQDAKYITAGLQTNRHYTEFLLNRRLRAISMMVNGVYAGSQAAKNAENASSTPSAKDEKSFGPEVMKLFVTCPTQDTFQREWTKFKPTEDEIVDTFKQMLKSTLNNKTLELCLMLSELISFTLTDLVGTEIVRGKLLNMFCDSYVTRLYDEVLDNPWAQVVVSKIMTLLFCNFRGESRNMLEKIPMPHDFQTAKKLAISVIQGTREQGGDLGFTRRAIRRHMYTAFQHQNLLFLDEI